ncbi:MAG: class II fructose-bisphosphate aldolase [Butyricicoccus sp.]
MKWERDYVAAAAQEQRIVAGFNVFGYEDAQAVIHAAESEQAPVLLMLNRDARRTMELEHWAALLCSLAKTSAVPVGVHLDHCTDPAVIERAIQCGFTSVMYDGSKRPLDENLKVTRDLAQRAHENGVLLEAELGAVPYSDLGETEIQLTAPEEALQMQQQTEADWLAVSVGNIHRLTTQKVSLQFPVLEQIERCCTLPLVIHGASGIREPDILRICSTHVGKMNFGTILRKTLGYGLRAELEKYPDEFDRLKLFQEPIACVEKQARRIISLLWKRGIDL